MVAQRGGVGDLVHQSEARFGPEGHVVGEGATTSPSRGAASSSGRHKLAQIRRLVERPDFPLALARHATNELAGNRQRSADSARSGCKLLTPFQGEMSDVHRLMPPAPLSVDPDLVTRT